MNEINNLARQALPPTTTTTFQGNAQAFQSSLAGLGILLVMAILVIYIILGILYESFLHPITILSGLPSAGFGALLSLYLFHMAATKGWVSPLLDMNLDIYGFVGIIMLIGIVKKNAIMMIDFALEAQRKEGLSPADAIYKGCLVRFRPIMMTTMAALMGTLPIALGLGAGGEARRPLGSVGSRRAGFFPSRDAFPHACILHLHGTLVYGCRRHRPIPVLSRRFDDGRHVFLKQVALLH